MLHLNDIFSAVAHPLARKLLPAFANRAEQDDRKTGDRERRTHAAWAWGVVVDGQRNGLGRAHALAVDGSKAALRLAMLSVALTMLGACAVGPDFQTPAPPRVDGFLPGSGNAAPGIATRRGADISA